MLGNDFVMYRFHQSAMVSHVKKPKFKHILVLDNSGSMYHYTSDALHGVGSQLFNMQNTIPGTLILFDDKTTILRNIANSKVLQTFALPQQGQTNITLGIEHAIMEIAKEEDYEVHHILTFLSDGHHNAGKPLVSFTELRKQVNMRKVSIVVVGISSCDTSLGMRIKTELETVPIPGLESLYFASSHGEFDMVAAQLLSGMDGFMVGGTSHCVGVNNGGVFLDTNHHETSIYLQTNKPQIVIATQHDTLVVDGKRRCCFTQWNSDTLQADVQIYFDNVIPKMSRLKVANNGNMAPLEPYIMMLNNLLKCAEAIMLHKQKEPHHVEDVKLDCDEAYQRIPTNTRLRLLNKKLRGATMFFQTEKNRIEELRATLQNTSFAQAAYLTGMNKKYAAKACLRADTINTSVAEIFAKLQKDILPKLIKALPLDSIETKNEQTSILSCNTAKEQLQDWVTILESANIAIFENVYSLLVAFGFVGYPVKFHQNNAVQMDAHQTKCTHIETVPIDSCTLMFAQQMERNLRSPNSGEPISDCLVLVDCTCPNASLMAMKSEIYHYLSSVCLCRDLHMYSSQMCFSMHAHALIECMRQYQSNANGGNEFVNLAIKIIYSMRKMWTGFENTENKSLFQHWFTEWGGITQSFIDKCAHPAQLVLLLACLDDDHITTETREVDDFKVPMYNLFSEVLARELKSYLIFKSTGAGTNPDLQKAAIKLLQKLYNITSENSPKPLDDLLSNEPTIESIRESCQDFAEFDEAKFVLFFGLNVHEYVTNVLKPYFLAYELGLLIRNTNVEQLMEHNGDVPVAYQTNVCNKLHLLKAQPPIVDLRVMHTMFAQSVWKHDNASRANIVDQDVQHPATLQALIVELRLVHYLEACKYKHSEYLKIIGNVSLQNGLRCGTEEFEACLGVHTHALCKEKFWGYHQAAAKDPEKQKVFLKKSNNTVKF